MMKMTPEELKAGLAIYERIWNTVQGHKPDIICFALVSALATLVGGAAADPLKTAESIARNLVAAVQRPPEKSELN
jgi:hypothetical protein